MKCWQWRPARHGKDARIAVITAGADIMANFIE
jgi:hypothetical protein